MVDLGPTSSQELLDGSLLTFHGLVELYKGLITFVFISQSLKGRCHGIQRKSENWPFCRKKISLPRCYAETDWNVGTAMGILKGN